MLMMAGHIGGTSPRDVPATDEKCRDISRRSTALRSVSPQVEKDTAQDPAYRPTRPPPTNVGVRESQVAYCQQVTIRIMREALCPSQPQPRPASPVAQSPVEPSCGPDVRCRARPSTRPAAG